MPRDIPHPHLNIRFFLQPVKDKRASKEAGRPIYKDVEMFEADIVGDPTRTIVAPAHDKFIQAKRADWITMQNDDDMDDEEMRDNALLSYAQYYHEHYKVFRDMNDRAETGTPIEMLPFIPPRRQMELKARGIKTVEGLANLADRLLKDCGPQTRDERDQARAWMDKADQAAIAAAANAEKAAMAAQLKALQDQVEFLLRTKGNAAPVADGPEGWDADRLKAFLVERNQKPRANASRENLVAAVLAIMEPEPEVDMVED